MINKKGKNARKFQQGLRPTIRNMMVPLAIKDLPKLVKKALLVEEDIDDTNQIQEQKGDGKGKQKKKKKKKTPR